MLAVGVDPVPLIVAVKVPVSGVEVELSSNRVRFAVEASAATWVR